MKRIILTAFTAITFVGLGFGQETKIGFYTHDDFEVEGNSVAHYGMSRISSTGYHRVGLSGYFGLDFYTEGKNRMQILKNGNIGIGTTTPSLNLHIKDPAGGAALGIERGGEIWRFDIQNTGNNLFLKNSKGRTDDYFTFTKYGNLGIGTTTPKAKLDVRGTIMIPKANTTDNNSPGLIYVKDDFLYDGEYLNHYGFGFHAFNGTANNTTSHINSYISGYYGVDFFAGGQNRVRVQSNGNVGIGTTSPDEKLTVKGKIHAEEVRVDLSVPADYVFEKYYTGQSQLKADYIMPTLEEVEAFTKINNHLPSIPSAQEIKEEGLHLKEMTNLLLQKIEELTLYTIEQQKQLQAQQQEIQELKKKVK